MNVEQVIGLLLIVTGTGWTALCLHRIRKNRHEEDSK